MAVIPIEKLPLARYLSSKDFYYARGSRTFSMDISMQMTEVVRRYTKKLPCEDAPRVVSCLTNCIDKQIYTKHAMNCRLPFMPETQNTRMCNTMEEFLEMKNATRDMYENFNLTDCSCTRECRATIYSVDELVTDSNAQLEGKFNLRIHENSFPKTQEDAAYSFIKLLSDLGGAMGLFFGLGFLQLLELLADCVGKLNTHIKFN